MNFKKYLQNFLDVDGVEAVRIIPRLSNPKVYHSREFDFLKDAEFKKLMASIQKKILNFRMKSFKLETLEHTVLCMIQENSALLFLLDKSVNLEELKQSINRYLNALLINI
jgi:hypothetical protein